MRPPRCYVCWRGLPDDVPDDELVLVLDQYVTLVWFAIAEDEECHDREDRETFVRGQPRNAIWFCSEHAPFGLERQSMCAADALVEILRLTQGQLA